MVSLFSLSRESFISSLIINFGSLSLNFVGRQPDWFKCEFNGCDAFCDSPDNNNICTYTSDGVLTGATSPCIICSKAPACDYIVTANQGRWSNSFLTGVFGLLNKGGQNIYFSCDSNDGENCQLILGPLPPIVSHIIIFSRIIY
jgi:hypothetical protein